MNPHSKIVLNTAVSYARTVLGAIFALFSSRWVLDGLGQNDYGIFVLVGSVIVFITFLNSVMAGSVSRHFAYEIGKGLRGEINKWFNTALSVHIVATIILILIGTPLIEYCIRNVFEIAPDRVQSALWVFRVSIFAAFVNMVSVPFIGMFTAHQKIAELSLIYIVSSIFLFMFTFTIAYYDGDRLIYYAIGYVGINASFQIIQIIRAFRIFPQCRINTSYWWNKQRIKEIVSFAGWNLIGSTGALFRNQGNAILLNLYFGTKLNAAFGIANQMSTQVSSLSMAMNNAISPEITTNEGRGERDKVINLSLRASKFATLLLLLFCVPIMIDIDYILALWLKNPPEYCAVLCRLLLLVGIIDNLTVGNTMAVNAKGKIAVYQATLGTMLLLTLPIAWMFIALGLPPYYVGWASVITIIGCSSGRIYFAEKLIGTPVLLWFKTVFLKCVIVALGIFVATAVVKIAMPPSILRLIVLVFVDLLVFAFIVWFGVLCKSEKEFFKSIITKILRK